MNNMLIDAIFLRKSKTTIILFGSAMFISMGIVLIATTFFKDFFFIDDAQNAFLPFYKEIGRIILSGHPPVLTTSTFLGTNILVDMVHSPFSPQTIITGLLATHVESFRLAANFLAWFNITLVILGAYWLGRVLTIRPSYALLLGFIVATNPVFLYVYSASWWNFASAFAWFTVSFAALLQFRINQSAWIFLIAVLSLCFLFASAGTHMQFVYIVGFCLVLVFDGYQYRSFYRIMYFTFIAVCAGFISAIPLISEFFLNSNMIERTSDFNNAGNFLVPSWGSLFNAFNPFYSTYIHWFSGYRFIPISLGYVGIISIILYFSDNTKKQNTACYKIVFSIAVLMLVLVFSSSQFGPMRWPFRYLPVWSMMVSSLIVFHIEKSTFHFSREKLCHFGGLVFAASLIQLFSSDNSVFSEKSILFVLLFIFLCIGFVKFFLKYSGKPKNRIRVLWLVTIFAWIGMLTQTQSLGKKGIMPYNPNLTGEISGLLSEPPSSYVLGLTPNIPDKPLDVADLGSAQFFLYRGKEFKAVNGYTPAGHIGIRKLLPYFSAHGHFVPYETLKNISLPSELRPDLFNYQLLNIGYISAWKNDITPEIYTLLTRAGLQIEPYPVGDRVLISPKKLREVEGSLTYQSISGSVKFDYEDGMTNEWFKVETSSVERVLIFSRVYWPGYHALINGKEYRVSSYKNTLVKVIIPPDVSGQMHLYYEPVSWQYSKWLIIVGVVLCGIVSTRLTSIGSEKNAGLVLSAK